MTELEVLEEIRDLMAGPVLVNLRACALGLGILWGCWSWWEVKRAWRGYFIED